MNSADDKGLSEGMASIFNTIPLRGWKSQTIKNEFIYTFSMTIAFSMCHHDEQILSHSHSAPHATCECEQRLRWRFHQIIKKCVKRRMRWKGMKCRSSSKVISDKESLSGFVSAIFIFTVAVCFRLSIEQSFLNLPSRSRPQLKSNNWPFLLLNEDK